MRYVVLVNGAFEKENPTGYCGSKHWDKVTPPLNDKAPRVPFFMDSFSLKS
jgi:hypothetical protein